MLKADKTKVVEQLVQQIKDAKSVTIIDYQGMANKQLGEIRQKIKKTGGSFLVAKNTLVKRALDESGNKITPEVEKGLTGPTAVILANEDEIAPLQTLGKVILEFNLPKFKFGIFNSILLDSNKLLALSKLPGKSVLVSKLLGTLSCPQYQLVGVLNGNLQKLVYILNERSKSLNKQ